MTEISAHSARPRVQSIDILRGLVMVIMALDHVRDFFFTAGVTGTTSSLALEPTNLETTTPLLFFTRWVTHFCAPIFVFLAGTSVFLMSQKKSKKQLSGFLLTRGLWLIVVEVVIITFAWTFNPFYNLVILQVIWAIGISMVLLGILIWLPRPLLLTIGALIVFGHNLLARPDIADHFKGSLVADLVYYANFSPHAVNPEKTHFIFIVYAFLPWLGLMILGYGFGQLYGPDVDPARRKKILIWLGTSLLVLFLVLRFARGYGDPVPMSEQPRGPVFTFLSFLNVTKYPPSLAFLSVTIGVAMLALALLENRQSRFTGVFRTYGRVPMLYYILHFYIIHTIAVVVFFAEGFTTDQIVTPDNPFLFKPPGMGFGLAGVYLTWLFVVGVLYPVCRWYDRYKSTHRHWWLSYL